MSHWYLTPEEIIRKRYNWFVEVESLGSVSLACKRFEISRKTFYKWRWRFRQARGDPNSLLNRSRRP
ncbi:MAG: helix-turn-helix domain-containing protein [Thermodesulfobacteriota bacterium]